MVRDREYWLKRRVVYERALIQLALKTKKKTKHFQNQLAKIDKELKACTANLRDIA